MRIWHVCSVVDDLSRAKHASPGTAIQIFEELFIGCYNGYLVVDPTKHVRDRAAAMTVLLVEKPGPGTHLLDCVREAFAKHATP